MNALVSNVWHLCLLMRAFVRAHKREKARGEQSSGTREMRRRHE